ncbi:MAG TPA: hypothetical protein VN366_02875 [Feifaniaceae bacterium]|nr:hypothetical protein [Feifaniaceae bacterium]
MADNAIDIIREAELEAEKILLQAARESERIKTEAYAEAASEGKLAEAAAKAAAEAAVSASREKSLLASHKAEAALEEELRGLRREAASKRGQAVAAVIHSLV